MDIFPWMIRRIISDQFYLTLRRAEFTDGNFHKTALQRIQTHLLRPYPIDGHDLFSTDEGFRQVRPDIGDDTHRTVRTDEGIDDSVMDGEVFEGLYRRPVKLLLLVIFKKLVFQGKGPVDILEGER